MTDEELKAQVAENSEALRAMRDASLKWNREWRESQQEWDLLWQEILAGRQERDRQRHESRQETDRLTRDFDPHQGRPFNEIGDDREALCHASLERVLRERFRMTTVVSRVRIPRENDLLEIDMLGYCQDEIREVYLVEIKSQLWLGGIEQLLANLRRFPLFFPEHRGKKLFGILAAFEVPVGMPAQVSKQGLYLATIKDDGFDIDEPDRFEPRAFGLREA